MKTWITCCIILFCGMFVRAEEIDENEYKIQEYTIGDSDYFKIKARMICGENRKIINKIGRTYCMPRTDRPVTLTVEDALIDEKWVEYEYVDKRYEWKINQEKAGFEYLPKTASSCTFSVQKSFVLDGDMDGLVKIFPTVKEKSTGKVTELPPTELNFIFNPWANISADVNNDGLLKHKEYYVATDPVGEEDDYRRDKGFGEPCKFLIVNTEDADDDGEPDFMNVADTKLFDNMPDIRCDLTSVLLDDCYFKITYADAKPDQCKRGGGNTLDNPPTFDPGGGTFRLWYEPAKKFIESGKTYHLGKDLGTSGVFTLKLEAVREGGGTLTISCCSPSGGEIGIAKTVSVNALPGRILFDVNRDGKMDDTDQTLLYLGKGFHCWNKENPKQKTNSKSVQPLTANEGIPPIVYGFGGGTGSEASLDDLSVLVDRFPVCFDVGALLERFYTQDEFPRREDGNGEIFSYEFEHKSYPLKWANPMGLSQGESLKYHTDSTIKTTDATASELLWACNMLSTAEMETKGLKEILRTSNSFRISIFEGTAAEEKIQLNLVLKNMKTNAVLMKIRTWVKMSSPIKMIHYANMAGQNIISNTHLIPPNYPEELCNNSVLAFIHGYMPSEYIATPPIEQTVTTFKRNYWSGSNARFCGLEWITDIGYHQSVLNAFSSADSLKISMEPYKDKKVTILAHSLGNLVVSNSIKNFNFRPEFYFALNSAVPSESYGTSNLPASEIPREVLGDLISMYMLASEWREHYTLDSIRNQGGSAYPSPSQPNVYMPRTWASFWYKIFPDNNQRSKLKWKNIFSGLNTKMYNYYSPKDEIFDFLDPANLPSIGMRYAYQTQEQYKGDMKAVLGQWMGWGFHREWKWNGYQKVYTIDAANALTDTQLRTTPVFYNGPAKMIGTDQLSQADINEVLSRGIPALTPATGKVSVVGAQNIDILSVIMSGKPWPRICDLYKVPAWYHSDFKDMPYYYTKPFFDHIVKQGALK